MSVTVLGISTPETSRIASWLEASGSACRWVCCWCWCFTSPGGQWLASCLIANAGHYCRFACGAGSPFLIVISLLIGVWTHLFLDSITHPDGWLVEHLPVLQSPVLTVGQHRFLVCEVLYAGCTFAGVAWLAFCYLQWLENAAGSPGPGTRGMKWGCSLLLASSVLFIALASRGEHQLMGIVPAGIIAILLVIIFLLATELPFRQTRSTGGKTVF